MSKHLLAILFVVLAAHGTWWTVVNGEGPPQPIETLKQWNLLSYNFPWDWPTSSKDFYNPENIVATGIEVAYDRIFIATPRLFSGVPATLSTIPRSDQGDSPVLEAYPDWSYHSAGLKQYNCSDIGLVSVYRMRLDSCNRLWALDAGVSRSLEDFEITCPPKILVIDTNTDQVVRRIDFPREVLRGESLFTNLIIDETTSRPENNCDDVFIYITDTVEPAIIVYDSEHDYTWRLSHPSMFPDPDFAESTIHNHRFTLMDGIVGIAFDRDTKTVYYQPLATDRLFSVQTDVLRAGPLSWNQSLAVKLVGRKSSQGLGLAVAPHGGAIFFSPFTETAVAKWNPSTHDQKVLAYDTERLQFVADIKTSTRDPTFVFMLSSKFHRFFLKNVDKNEINTRIMQIDIGGFEPVHPIGNGGVIAYHQQEQFQPNAIFGIASVTTPSPLKPVFPFTSNPDGDRFPRPYRFEQNFGSFGKSPFSPFPLNTGEQRSQFFGNRFGQGPLAPSSLLQAQKFLGGFNDFNGVRYAKSVAFNTSVVHKN